MTLDNIEQIVNLALEKLGVNPLDSKKENNAQWDLITTDLHIMIDVFQLSNQKVYLQLLSKLISISEQTPSHILAEFLEENHTLIDMNLSKYKDGIYLKSIQNAELLNESATEELIIKFSDYGKSFISKFKNKE